MFVDIELAPANPFIDMVSRISTGRVVPPKRLRTGAYQIGHFNFEQCLIRRPTFKESYPEIGDVSSYGVTDSPDQFFELLGKELEESPRKFVVSFTEVRRDDQESEGGWRWHKWGPYIGKHEPKCEYLFDEKDIEAVFIYSIIEIDEGTKP